MQLPLPYVSAHVGACIAYRSVHWWTWERRHERTARWWRRPRSNVDESLPQVGWRLISSFPARVCEECVRQEGCLWPKPQARTNTKVSLQEIVSCIDTCNQPKRFSWYTQHFFCPLMVCMAWFTLTKWRLRLQSSDLRLPGNVRRLSWRLTGCVDDLQRQSSVSLSPTIT